MPCWRSFTSAGRSRDEAQLRGKVRSQVKLGNEMRNDEPKTGCTFNHTPRGPHDTADGRSAVHPIFRRKPGHEFIPVCICGGLHDFQNFSLTFAPFYDASVIVLLPTIKSPAPFRIAIFAVPARGASASVATLMPEPSMPALSLFGNAGMIRRLWHHR